MSPPTVWFNKHLSNTWEVLAILKEHRLADEFRVLCTHPRGNYVGQTTSDAFEQEPVGLGQEEYVNYCLDVARRLHVNLFLPGRNLLPIVRAAEQFAALGSSVLGAANAATLAVINSKASVYRALWDECVPIPDYEVVNDLAGFDAAWARLRPRHHILCYKPAVSVFGLGFRIVSDPGPLANPWLIRHEEARRRLAEKGRFRDLLVMQYLPGPERSVDCLARDGKLIRCIVRRKEEKGQLIEDNPGIVAVVRRLAAHFGLHHLFNVQFRDDAGTSYLLEINPRMSGGLPFACKSGLALPYWALRLALGTVTPDEIPQPRTGIWVPQPEPVSSL